MSVTPETVHAVIRFGLGPDEASLKAARDPKAWLRNQVGKSREIAALKPFVDTYAYTNLPAMKSMTPETRKEKMRPVVQAYQSALDQRFAHHCSTTTPFSERLVLFWQNHFAISADKLQVRPLAIGFEQDVIRPHIYGSFSDLLLASSRHPAMLLYLDNNRSIGPDSKIGQRRDQGLNENLAREILELHTLGVKGGYRQADVEALAQIITGWSFVPDANGQKKYVFRKNAHQPGKKTLLGEEVIFSDEKAGISALRRLGEHPSTAAHIAQKLAAHFIGDEPPSEAVATLKECFLDTKGDLKALSLALIDLPACWETPFAKVKDPYEWLISVYRGMQQTPATKERKNGSIQSQMAQLNYPLLRPGSPAGFPDRNSYWMGPDALMKRIEWAFNYTQKRQSIPEPDQLAERLFGERLSAESLFAVRTAPSPAEGLAALLVSPEYLRR